MKTGLVNLCNYQTFSQSKRDTSVKKSEAFYCYCTNRWFNKLMDPFFVNKKGEKMSTRTVCTKHTVRYLTHNFLFMPRIERSGAYCFTGVCLSVRLSVKNLT